MSVLSQKKFSFARPSLKRVRLLALLLVVLLSSIAFGQIPVQAAAPVAYNQSVATNEDESKAIVLTADDEDGDTINYAIVNLPLHGTLDGSLPNVVYTPDTNYNGPDSFTFRANAGGQDSDPATVSITVVAVNDAPVAFAQSVSTAEDTALSIALIATDVDLDSLTFSIVTGPSNGVLSGSGPNVTYTPNVHYHGSDSFTFKASDGTADSNTAVVTITVNPVEDVPVANAQMVVTAQDTPKAFTLTGSDADGDPLTYSIITLPANGILSGTAPNLTYTPNASYKGPDSFTFKVNDGNQDSAPATVSIMVNDPPVADDQSVSTDEDIPIVIALTGSDPESDPLTFITVLDPPNGSLSGGAPNLTYTPDTDFNGVDSFTFKVNDGYQDSNEATVTITVNPIEDPPIANSQEVTTNEDVPVAITLTGSDGDEDPLTFITTSNPVNGVLSGTRPNLVYTPNLNFYGSDSFTFIVNDGDQNSAEATVFIEVTAVNDPPAADDQSVTTLEDTPIEIVLTASDVEDDDLSYAIATSPAHGTLNGSGPNLTYTPDADYNGEDSFTFAANDGENDSNEATVRIEIGSVEDAPITYDQDISTDEDIPIAITLQAYDGDDDPLTYTIIDFPDNGSLGDENFPNITYTPDDDYFGSDSFSFQVNDGDQNSNVATVNITIQPVNDAPVAEGKTLNTNEDTPASILLSATDVDDETLTFHITEGMGGLDHGTLSGTAPDLTYSPDPNYNGSDFFWYQANDGKTNSAPVLVSIQIAPVNDPPVGNDLEIDASEDLARGITLTGTDIDGEQDQTTLSFSILDQPTEGVLTGTPPLMTYTPAKDYYGADAFTFVVRDTAGLTDTAQVNINVINTNDNPRTTDDSATVKEDSFIEINLVHNDTYLPDPPETLTIVNDGFTEPMHGSVTPQSGGSHVTYTPAENYFGQDTFDYTIRDGNGGFATGTVVITVTNENDPPLALPDNVAMDEDGETIEIDVLANDTYLPDPIEDLIIISISDAPNGTVTIMPGNKKLTYRPRSNYFGTDLFTYGITDRHSGYHTTSVRVQVRPVNDPPVAEDDYGSTTEDSPVTINVVANDEDIDSSLDLASIQITAAPSHGTAQVNPLLNGTIIYDPVPDWNGIDSLTYQICDDATPALCDKARVDISVGSVNDPPVSDAGPDQTVDTNTRVTLDGSGSHDPDNNLPLAYEWIRTSGPPVVLTDSTAESPSFIAPDDPCTLVFELMVIDDDGQGRADLTPDQVVITVQNQPPISDAGPDKIHPIESLVTLDGSRSTDPDGDLPLQYLWTQIGGTSVELSDERLPSPTFIAPSANSVLTFTLYVTDTFGEPDATPDQVVITISEPFYIYLPSTVVRHVSAPDLVIESLVATSRNVELVIKNRGDASVTNPFWVDVYINPIRPPAAVNETFDELGTYGLAWAVTPAGVKQLVPGGTLTLRMNDVYFYQDLSEFPDNLQPGTPIYAQVDSFNPGTDYGTVLEKHEVIDGPYNNIYGPTLSQESTAAMAELPPALSPGNPVPQGLPKRH